MNQSPAPAAPVSRTPRTYSAITRLLLWVVLAVWAVFALTLGALHLWIVPRIDAWRPDLERWASSAVGVPVKVGAIRAASVDETDARNRFLFLLVPALELSDVRLFDPAGREALHLPRVHAAISVTSLWRRGFEQLLIEGPVLDIRRTAKGRIEVAGLDFSDPQDNDGQAADWFFAQTEFVIRNGTVRWTDELRNRPTLALSALDFVSRNSVRSHQLRLDATPPAEWGQPFTLMGNLREPLLDLDLGPAAREHAPWHNWSGELYADFPAVDVSRLKTYVDLSEWDVEVRTGRGKLRAWGDLDRGQLAGVTTDLGLQQVATKLASSLPEMALDSVDGRIAARWSAEGFELSTDNLAFKTTDGLDWRGAKVRVKHDSGLTSRVRKTSIDADQMELAALAAIATRVPLPEASRKLLASLRPTGRIEGFSASWQGPVAPPAKPGQPAPPPPDATAYQARGRAVGLALASQPSGEMSSFGPYPVPGRPGVTAANVEFGLDQDGGTAKVSINNGSLDLVGVFENPVVPLSNLQADARWTVKGERIEAWVDNLKLANADAAGSGRFHWVTADPARSKAKSRLPGVLDLDATLTRADARQVYRYMPLSVSADVRRYVQEAVRGGSSDKVEFRVRGDVWDLPFNEAGTDGEFRITAALKGLDFAYLPAFLQSAGEPVWPALKGMEGQLVLDKVALRITNLAGGVEGQARVRLSEAEIAIPDMMKTPTLAAAARAQGPASEVLGFVQGSPLNGLLGKALDKATATGSAGVLFKLGLPLLKSEDFTLQGAVQLAGNDLRITPESPLLERASGNLVFTEKSFRLGNARAHVYGGDLAFEGGMTPADTRGPSRIEFRGQGFATAEGLRAGGLGVVSRLFAQASGSAAYTARLGFRGGVPEVSVSTNLQGMAVDLPPPLNKRAEEVQPLRYDNVVTGVGTVNGGEVARTDRLAVEVGPAAQPLLSVLYDRDITEAEPRVLRGSLAAGLQPGETAPVPTQGVLANVRVDRVEVNAWEKVFNSIGGVDVRAATTSSAPASTSGSLAYLPTVLAARAGQVVLDGRTFNNVVLGGSREGTQWRTNIEADELNGYVEYRQPSGNSAGAIYARLAQLNLPPSAAADVEQLLEQPTSVPALDITVENLVMAGRQLGLVDIQAVNRGSGRTREWRLNKLNIRVPEARLIGSGNWTASEADGGARRTRLDFRLDVDDSGKLLARFGKPGVVRNGKGTIEGNIHWKGSPLTLDYPSMSGEMNANFEAGQFLKVEPGAAKLLGVLSLQALPRRLTLDFRDVFSEGFAFDFVRGDVQIRQGVASTNNLQMKGVNAAVLMEGTADIVREQQDIRVVVVPEINAGTASLIATAINPAIGLGTFIANFLLREPLQSATTQQFHISGSWADPKVEKIEQPKPPKDPAAPAAPPATAPAVK
ncbi:YhdP family protein [Hydrogenophaga sp.]|uniref:YhdP family protein n=1 Tax=Hydrogenophaga sp. TaxID=1904254 RepID=UPI0035B461FC